MVPDAKTLLPLQNEGTDVPQSGILQSHGTRLRLPASTYLLRTQIVPNHLAAHFDRERYIDQFP